MEYAMPKWDSVGDGKREIYIPRWEQETDNHQLSK